MKADLYRGISYAAEGIGYAIAISGLAMVVFGRYNGYDDSLSLGLGTVVLGLIGGASIRMVRGIHVAQDNLEKNLERMLELDKNDG